MQALQKTLEQVRSQFSRLPVNARLLIGSLMIILVMGLLLVSQYAGQSNLAPLGLPATADVREAALQHLRAMNVNFEDRGDDIYVPADRQYELIGQLSERQIVSTHQIDFNALIEHNANPFIGRDQARQNWLTAKMNVLSAMIAARNDVSMARVIIDPPARSPGIGAAHIATKATVAVQMRGAPLSQDTADVFGRMVAGSQAGLKVSDVPARHASAPDRRQYRDGSAVRSAVGTLGCGVRGRVRDLFRRKTLVDQIRICCTL